MSSRSFPRRVRIQEGEARRSSRLMSCLPPRHCVGGRSSSLSKLVQMGEQSRIVIPHENVFISRVSRVVVAGFSITLVCEKRETVRPAAWACRSRLATHTSTRPVRWRQTKCRLLRPTHPSKVKGADQIHRVPRAQKCSEETMWTSATLDDMYPARVPHATTFSQVHGNAGGIGARVELRVCVFACAHVPKHSLRYLEATRITAFSRPHESPVGRCSYGCG